MTARIAVTALGVACIVATAPSHPQPECCGEGYTLTPYVGPPWWPDYLGSYWTEVWPVDVP